MAAIRSQYFAIMGELGEQVQSVGGAVLTIASRELTETLTAKSVTATEDGRGAITSAWHEGESSGEVYVERYGLAGREFHGWVDAETRRLVQSG